MSIRSLPERLHTGNLSRSRLMAEERWQPIETAPKDGAAILVMRDIWPGTSTGRATECNGHNTYVAAWWEDEGGVGGAWMCYFDRICDPRCPVVPTHWMPLPKPPEPPHG
jgi:hypothetical protein